MSNAITLERKPGKVYIGLDTNYFQEENIIRILERLRVEYLAKVVDFQDDIEEVGTQVKADWWQKNKQRFIPENEL